MIPVILTLFGAFCVLSLCEFLFKRKIIRGEYARKFAHIVLGIYLAVSCLYLSWDQLRLLTIVGFLGAVAMHFLKLFKSIYDIDRSSWGDLLGPLTFAVLTFVTTSRVLFIAVVLHVALADGLAAIVGVRYGKNNGYKVFGYNKSIVGTFTFFCTSLIIMTAVLSFASIHAPHPELSLVAVPLATAAIENIAIFGVDNLLISVTVYGLFSLLKI